MPILFDPNLSQYKNMLEIKTHKMTDIVKAQAIKDATMAYFIQKNRSKTVYFWIWCILSDFKKGIIGQIMKMSNVLQ